MKTIKSSLLGNKSLNENDDKVLLNELSSILKKHRELIIDRLIRDIPTYVDYKFNVRLNRKDIFSVKENLIQLKNSEVELDLYKTIVSDAFLKEATHITNAPFYQEIDECISSHVLSNVLQSQNAQNTIIPALKKVQ
jgi:hypothetical protein